MVLKNFPKIFQDQTGQHLLPWATGQHLLPWATGQHLLPWATGLYLLPGTGLYQAQSAPYRPNPAPKPRTPTPLLVPSGFPTPPGIFTLAMSRERSRPWTIEVEVPDISAASQQ